MADEEQERLRRLAELRRRSRLADDEPERASARVRVQREPEPKPQGPSIWEAWWPAFVGFGVLVLMIAALVIYGRMTAATEDAGDLNIAVSIDAGSNVIDAAQKGAESCGSVAAYARIKDEIFNRAQALYGGDPAPLDSLRNAVSARMQYPQVRGLREDVGRTDCGGHLVIDLPPSVRTAFDGLPALEADLEYGVQQAANGSGSVVELKGVDDVVRQLAVAAGLVGGPGKAPIEEPRPEQAYSPSFACRGMLSNVERMICHDEQLSRLDREVAERFVTLRRELSGADWMPVNDAQRAFLRRRAACLDVACLNDAYVAQVRVLQRLEAAYLG